MNIICLKKGNISVLFVLITFEDYMFKFRTFSMTTFICVLKNPISLIFSLFGFRDHCFKVEAFTNPTPTPAAGVSISIVNLQGLFGKLYLPN